MWDAETEKVVMKLDGLGASELLGDEPASLSVLSASISHTQPWFQVAMSTDLASYLFTVRSGRSLFTYDARNLSLHIIILMLPLGIINPAVIAITLSINNVFIFLQPGPERMGDRC